ncbi:MAG: hypothetical protein AAFM92_16310 [Pseudomonadota bacterium]
MKHVTRATELKAYTNSQKLLVLHAEDGWIDAVEGGHFDFFTKLEPALKERSVAPVIVTLGSELSKAIMEQNHIHLLLGDRPDYRPNLLHVSPAYLWGFWYLDELGINANSSLRFRNYHPEAVDAGHAEWFFNGVSSWNLERNVSRLPQADRGTEHLEPAQSVIFCQEVEERRPRAHYLTTDQMIRNAARAAGGGIVYVKPHPAQSDGARRRIEHLAENDPNIRISEASVHDLIATSDWVISQNSAAGFEALMQRKKIITCGPSDYHHASLVAHSEEDLRRHLREGAGHFDGFDYQKYFYWFLHDLCLEPQAEGFAERAWARIAAKCFL